MPQLQLARHALLVDFLQPSEDDLTNYWFNKRLSQASHNFMHKYH